MTAGKGSDKLRIFRRKCKCVVFCCSLRSKDSLRGWAPDTITPRSELQTQLLREALATPAQLVRFTTNIRVHRYNDSRQHVCPVRIDVLGLGHSRNRVDVQDPNVRVNRTIHMFVLSIFKLAAKLITCDAKMATVSCCKVMASVRGWHIIASENWTQKPRNYTIGT